MNLFSNDVTSPDFIERTEIDAIEFWAIRGFMLIACTLPLFAIISAFCGNRFCGYVQMVVSGFFGAFSIWTFLMWYMRAVVVSRFFDFHK